VRASFRNSSGFFVPYPKDVRRFVTTTSAELTAVASFAAGVPVWKRWRGYGSFFQARFAGLELPASDVLGGWLKCAGPSLTGLFR
jgi:hypothetical protein